MRLEGRKITFDGWPKSPFQEIEVNIMRVTYYAYVGGTIDIDAIDFKGMNEDQKRDYIADYVTECANEDLDSHLTWEIDEE